MDTAQQHEHLKKILDDCRMAFMVTSGSVGFHGRPMATAKIEGLASIWFAASRDSATVRELNSNSEIFLGYTNTSGSEWASINGNARIVEDRAKAAELWSPFWKNWFTGPDDPNLILIEVTPRTAEYWDSGSKIIVMAKLAMAAVTGKHFDEGEHEKVSIGN